MLGFSIVALLLAATPISGHTHQLAVGGRARSVNISLCETEGPDTSLKAVHRELSAQKKLRKVKPRAPESFAVETYFHFVVTETEAAYYTPEMRNTLATAQYNALSTAYAKTGITFNLHPPTFTANTAWATNTDEHAMKSALRQGTYSALNLYFQSHLSSPGFENDPSSFLLGYCELPTAVTRTSCTSAGGLSPNGSGSGSGSGCTTRTDLPTEYTTNGCNVLLSSMPNGGMQTYDQGKTAVHEVGHWFGLLHTFQDNSCDKGSSGDFIADTAQEMSATDGCPVGKDSCPGSLGVDPIGNFMDYSSDAWYVFFSLPLFLSDLDGGLMFRKIVIRVSRLCRENVSRICIAR